MDRDTDRQTDGQRHRQTDRETETQTDRQKHLAAEAADAVIVIKHHNCHSVVTSLQHQHNSSHPLHYGKHLTLSQLQLSLFDLYDEFFTKQTIFSLCSCYLPYPDLSDLNLDHFTQFKTSQWVPSRDGITTHSHSSRIRFLSCFLQNSKKTRLFTFFGSDMSKKRKKRRSVFPSFHFSPL